MIAVILKLIASCSSLESSPSPSFISPEKIDHKIEAPDIPFDRNEAFFPLRYREDGKILPSYQWEQCVKRFIVCLKFEKRIAYFENLEWFEANGFGLTRLKKR
jgi:hypothetical protein